MIGIPEYARPSFLLWCERLSPAAEMLCEECATFTAASPSRALESLIRDAGDLCDRGAQQCCALVLVHLADRCRELGKLGPALRCAERAEELFCTWPEEAQIHNHAVTLYLLGLVHQLLGLDREALDYYHRALSRFSKAETHWAASSREEQQLDCGRAKKWIETLSRYVARARTQGGRTALHCSVVVGFGPTDILLERKDLPLVHVTDESLVARLRLHQEEKVYEPEMAQKDSKEAITLKGVQQYYLLPPEHLDQADRKYPNAEYLLFKRGREFTYHLGQDLDRVRFVGDEESQDVVGIFKEVA